MKVIFLKCIQNVQQLGTTDECMFSKLFFSLEVNGDIHPEEECIIKQTVGSDFENDHSIEVFVNFPKHRRVNYGKFQQAAKDYYFSLVGSTGTGIRVINSSVKMFDNIFEKKQIYDIT